jgi:hypothetical protein
MFKPYYKRGRIDTDREVIANAYALAYDSHNQVMLNKRSPHSFDRTSPKTIRAKFKQLKGIARRYCPGKLRAVERLERIALDCNSGRLNPRTGIHQMRMIAMTNCENPHTVTPLLANLESQINWTEGYHARRMPVQRDVKPPRQPTYGIFNNVDKTISNNFKRGGLFPQPSDRAFQRSAKFMMKKNKKAAKQPSPGQLIKRMFGGFG